MTRTPDFSELVGADLPQEERDRLRRVHDLLIAAGPPPEVPPALASAPAPGATVTLLPRRRKTSLVLLAAALAAIAFGGGYLLGGRDDPEATAKPVDVIRMRGTESAPRAIAVLRVGKRDESGNLPMDVTVQGLKTLKIGNYYELQLTKHGKPVVSCGTFNVAGTGPETVRLSVAYDFHDFDGWVVTEYIHGRDRDRVVLAT